MLITIFGLLMGKKRSGICLRWLTRESHSIALPRIYIGELKDEYLVHVAIGYNNLNAIRRRIYTELDELKYRFASYWAPDVKIWSSNAIGKKRLHLRRSRRSLRR